ncbi:DUF2523 family protein [Vibrio cyclitrophicus]
MLDNILNKIEIFFESLILTLEAMTKDIVYFFIDELLEMAISALEKLAELMDYLDFSQFYSMLPDDIYNALGALGFGEALTMIVSTIFLKIILKLLPFTKLGSK